MTGADRPVSFEDAPMNSSRRPLPSGSLLKRALAMIALLCAAPGATYAASDCVDTVAEFYNALNTAMAQPADQPYTIKLVQGTYNFGNYTTVPTSQVSLLGGYDDSSCTSRHVNAANTVVDFGGSGFLTIVTTDASPQAAVTVEGVTFQHGEHVAFSAGQALQIFDHTGSVTVRDVRFTDFIAGDTGMWDTASPVTLDVIKGTLTLQNVAFDHLHQPPGGVCAVDASLTDSGANARMNFVSADLIEGRSFCLDPDTNGQTSDFRIYNSVFWNTDNLQGPLDALQVIDYGNGSTVPNVYLYANTIYAFGGPAVLTESGTLNADPGAAPLWSNPVAGVGGDYNLLPTSASINSGIAAGPNGAADVPAYDIQGRARKIGSAPDRGAYESAYVDTPSTVVTSTADSGPGTLRTALSYANVASDVNTITFALPSCPAVIKLDTQLVVNNPVIIDGYKDNPAAKYNDDPNAFNATLCVVVEEATPGSVFSAFVSNSNLTVRGIAFGGFYDTLQLAGSDSTISGNQFGGSVGGVTLPGANANAIWVKNLPSGNITIGGLTPGERNVISAATQDGILLDSSVTTSQCHVQGNLIGLAPNGLSEIGNEYGIEIKGNNCVVSGNRIAANFLDGIWINGGKFNTIQGNSFGSNVWGNSTNSYGWAVRVDGTNNVIGAPNNVGYLPALGNIITFMDTGGVLVNSYNNSVRGNLVDFNGYPKDGSAPDVELTANGNFQQPFPTITKLALPGGLPVATAKPATVSGHLSSGANAYYRVDVYYSGTCSPAGRGHADYYLASQQVKTDAAGSVYFDIPVTLPQSAATSVLSLNATDAYADSSEIGTCFGVDTIFRDGLEKF
jgi:parallel beta-helix repeat protein